MLNKDMGIRNWFKKAGNWIKDKFHKAKNVVGKFVKPVATIVKKGINFIDKTPIGPALSKLSGGVYDTAKKVINLIPDGAVKNNIQNFADKAQATTNQVINKVENIQDKARDMIDRGKQAANIIKGSM